jgi:hypothetical protein
MIEDQKKTFRRKRYFLTSDVVRFNKLLKVEKFTSSINMWQCQREKLWEERNRNKSNGRINCVSCVGWNCCDSLFSLSFFSKTTLVVLKVISGIILQVYKLVLLNQIFWFCHELHKVDVLENFPVLSQVLIRRFFLEFHFIPFCFLPITQSSCLLFNSTPVSWPLSVLETKSI